MVHILITKMFRDPVGVLRRFFWKTVIGPLRYVKSGYYDAERYWQDRYRKYGTSLRGAGDEGLSEEENVASKKDDAQVLLQLCRQESINLSQARVLDVGCGTGFFAGFLRDQGVKHYVGADITDVLFPQLRATYPTFTFRKADITTDTVPGEFDLVLMLYVIIHIMDEERLSQALAHVRQVLSEHGCVLIGPLQKVSERRFFYLRSWSLEDIQQRFPGFHMGPPVPFREGFAVAVRKA
ncbi:MAG TPA: class I SAM-dependent methyltransferase [Gemmataceae bacterium]|nr:class I SAM-dependent methyltransferase [Gemmataceae bacterium]